MKFKTLILAGVAIIAVIFAAMIANLNDSSAETSLYLSEIEKENQRSLSWQYSEQKDQMRGQTSKIARIRAVGFSSIQPDLIVLQDKSGEHFVMIQGQAESGAYQMRCEGHVTVKFDKNPLKEFPCVMGMAVGITGPIFDGLSQANTIWIETQTNHMTRMQFEFNTAGLNFE